MDTEGIQTDGPKDKEVDDKALHTRDDIDRMFVLRK